MSVEGRTRGSRTLTVLPGSEPRQPVDRALNLSEVRERFDASVDLTVGIEEEFAIVDPATYSLADRFGELRDAALQDDVLADRIAGELIGAEVEVRSEAGRSFESALDSQCRARSRLFELARELDLLLAATGTHPWSPWHEQRILDTPHYRRLERDLGYVARRNNTFSLHVHVGVRGADRAIAVCDRLRPLLPALLALAANSPFLDGHDSGLHSSRSQIFTRSFPRCGIPPAWRDWAHYAECVELLARTNSIVEATQLWWSVRPHHSFGTVEVRICDAQTTADESTALAGLVVSCVAQAMLDVDSRRPQSPPPDVVLDENLWRALRYGLDGKLIDSERDAEFAAAEVPERLYEWTAPARAQLGLDPFIATTNGAQRQRKLIDDGATIDEVFRREVAASQQSYASSALSFERIAARERA